MDDFDSDDHYGFDNCYDDREDDEKKEVSEDGEDFIMDYSKWCKWNDNDNDKSCILYLDTCLKNADIWFCKELGKYSSGSKQAVVGIWGQNHKRRNMKKKVFGTNISDVSSLQDLRSILQYNVSLQH